MSPPFFPQSSPELTTRQCQLLGFLSKFFSGVDVELLCEAIQTHSKEDILQKMQACSRNSIFLSPSQTSSISSSIHSALSQDSSVSSESYTSPSPVAQGVAVYTRPNLSEHHGQAASGPFPDTLNSPATNQGSPHLQMQISNAAQFYCILCKKCYTKQEGLSKHRKEKCESSRSWVCRVCPADRTLVYEREYKLTEHHQNKHAAEGQLDTDSSYFKHPPKRAWGCPCCVACFHTIEDWQEHEKNHQDRITWLGRSGDIGVEDWSWNTLIASLLSSKNFSIAAGRYHWNIGRWKLGEEKWEHLKSVLERHVLPMEVMRYHEYRSRPGPEGIVFYVHQIGTTGRAYAGISIASELQSRPDAVVNSSCPVLNSSGQSFDTARSTKQSSQTQLNYGISTNLSSSFIGNSPHPFGGLCEQVQKSVMSSDEVSLQFGGARHLAQDQIRTTFDQTFNFPQGLDVSEPAHQDALQMLQNHAGQHAYPPQSSQPLITHGSKSPKRRKSIGDLWRSRPGSSKGRKAAADAPPVPTSRPQDVIFELSHLRDHLSSVPIPQAYIGVEDIEMRLNTPDGDSWLGTPGLTDATPSPSPKPTSVRSSQPRPVEPEEYISQEHQEPNYAVSWDDLVDYGEPTNVSCR